MFLSNPKNPIGGLSFCFHRQVRVHLFVPAVPSSTVLFAGPIDRTATCILTSWVPGHTDSTQHPCRVTSVLASSHWTHPNSAHLQRKIFFSTVPIFFFFFWPRLGVLRDHSSRCSGDPMGCRRPNPVGSCKTLLSPPFVCFGDHIQQCSGFSPGSALRDHSWRGSRVPGWNVRD